MNTPTVRRHVIKNKVSQADLDNWHKYGYQFLKLEFRQDGTLDAIVYIDEPLDEIPVQPAAAKSTMVMFPERSIPLTHNRLTARDTQPIQTLRLQTEMRREKNQAEIYDILNRHVENQKSITSSFKPFQLGVKPS